MTDIRCDEFSEVAPEVALGLLAGDERARAIGHLAACPACREHLEGLLRVADGLLLLAPRAEPAIGFELRVMERLAAEGAPDPARGPTPWPSPSSPSDSSRPSDPADPADPAGPSTAPARTVWRSRPSVALVAAALIVVAAVSGLVVGRTNGRRSAFDHQVSAARQLAARTVVVWADQGRSTCQLVAFPADGSRPARLVVHLDEPDDPAGMYQVLAEPADGGPAVPLGTITVANGQGLLTVAVPAGTGPVHGVRVLDVGRGVKYRATFSPV